MSIDPKGVARVIRGFIKSPQERKEEAELERTLQIKMAKTRLRRHINQQKEMSTRLKGLARQALAINDTGAFKKIARQYIWTNNDVQRWERYSLSLEMMEARRDQVKASVDLLSSIRAMSDSLSDLAAPEKIGELQLEIERGLAKASTVEEKLDSMMDIMDSTLASDMPVGEDELRELAQVFSDDVIESENAAFDPDIEQLRQKIRNEMQKS